MVCLVQSNRLIQTSHQNMPPYGVCDKIRKPAVLASRHGTNVAERDSLMKGQRFGNGQRLIINNWQTKSCQIFPERLPSCAIVDQGKT